MNRAACGCAILLLALSLPALARLDTKRYGELREAERYQMDVAEKLWDQRKWESAQDEFEKFINLYVKSPGAPYAQFLIAACCENRNLINQAIKEYKAVISYFPDSPEAPLAALAIGRCHAKCGEAELAVQQFLQVVAQYPEHPAAGDALWEASAIQLSRNLPEKAMELRRKLVDTYPKAACFPQAVDWLVDHYLFADSDVNAARTVCRLRRSPVEAERYLALRMYDRGYQLFQREGKKDEGVKAMDKAVELYRGIAEQFPTDKKHTLDALGMVAQCYRFSDRMEKSQEAFERVLKDFPEADGWRENYGRALEDWKRWSDARLQFMRFKDKAAGDFQIAESYHRQRSVKEAEEAYMRVVNDHPALAKQALYRIGDLHSYVAHAWDKAINAYRQSEYSPPNYLFRVAECFSAAKNHDMAIKTYQEIIGFFKDSAAEATWRIGLEYEKRKADGDKERAVASFKRVCDLYPGSSQSSAAHQRLEDNYKITYTGGGVKKARE